MPRDRFHTGSEGKPLLLRPLLLLEPLGRYSRHLLRAHGPPVDRLDAIDGLRHPGRPSAGGGGPRPVRRAKELSPPGGESRNLCAATVSHGRVPGWKLPHFNIPRDFPRLQADRPCFGFRPMSAWWRSSGAGTTALSRLSCSAISLGCSPSAATCSAARRTPRTCSRRSSPPPSTRSARTTGPSTPARGCTGSPATAA